MILHNQRQYPLVRAKQRRAQHERLQSAKGPHVERMTRITTKHKVSFAMRAKPVSEPSAGSHRSQFFEWCHFKTWQEQCYHNVDMVYKYFVSKSGPQLWLAIQHSWLSITISKSVLRVALGLVTWKLHQRSESTLNAYAWSKVMR
jgi:hypothetical protein